MRCITTIPRKQRTRAPMEDLSPRHIIIEELVSRLFPKVATRDLNELTKLAEYLNKHKVEISLLEDKICISAPQMEIFSPTIDPYQPSRERLGIRPPEPHTAAAARIGGYDRILQNSSGTLSYFGPSSSMAFVTRLRETLVSKGDQDLETLQPKQQRLQKDFIADKYCCTMEKPSCGRVSSVSPQSHAFEDRPSLRNDGVRETASIARPSRPQTIFDCFPLRQEVDELVELFFLHIHPNMVLFHRPLFQSALEELWECDKPESQDPGWMVCCCLVLVFGCECVISASPNTSDTRIHNTSIIQRKLLELALGKVAQLIFSATLQSVQSFALLSLYLNTTNQRNASWIMIGCAIRMAISIGMHREDELLMQRHIRVTPVERELRKRVWWTLYIFEQYSSALFGRPTAIDDVETSADLPIESVLDEGYHRPPGLIQYDVDLAKLVSNIRKKQARLGQYLSGEIQSADELLQALDKWYADLPTFLKFERANECHINPSHLRQLVALQLRYQHARLFLARPFLLQLFQKPSPATLDLNTKFGDICASAALESWNLISTLRQRGKFDGNIWLDGVFAYQSGMVMSLASLDARQRLATCNREELEGAIEGILDVLHEIPPNKPLSRLVQIADDFSSIVRAMRSCLGPNTTQNQRKRQQVISAVLPRCPVDVPDCQPIAENHQSNINAVSDDPTDLEVSENPTLALEAQCSNIGEVLECQPYLGWGFEGGELIDTMLDWDVSHAFGFDDDKTY